MAINDFSNWVPEEHGSDVLTAVKTLSAIERYGRSENMSTDVKNVPRSGGSSVAVKGKGQAYDEDTSTRDNVTLTARKFTGAVAIAEEELADSNVNIIESEQVDWASNYAKFLDNACLGTTGAEDGTTVPFTSVYAELTANLSGNIVQAATGVDVTYDDLSNTLKKVEDGSYFDDSKLVVIAHPSFRAKLRAIKDSNGNPVFVSGSGDNPDQLFGNDIQWSHGAKTNATASEAPTGNPLLVLANRDFLILGKRSGPESRVIPAAVSKSDEATLMMRSRRGFAVGRAAAFAVLEDVA